MTYVRGRRWSTGLSANGPKYGCGKTRRQRRKYRLLSILSRAHGSQGFWPVEVLQVPTLGLIKLSFIFFYRRIFEKRASPRFHIVSLIVIFVVAAWTISFFFSLLFICGTDFVAYWTSTVVEKEHCVNTNELHSAFAITDVITDVLVISMPLPMVRNTSP